MDGAQMTMTMMMIKMRKTDEAKSRWLKQT